MITKTTEWEGEHVRLVKLGGLPGKGYPRRRNGGPVDVVFVHQSGGSFAPGTDAPLALAEFHSAPPRYRLNSDGSIATLTVYGTKRRHRVGGGRGWPGCAHTFVVPGIPSTVQGKIEVYRLNDDDRQTPHTGGFYDRVGVSVCFAGTFKSRHTRPAHRERLGPEPDAMLAGAELILDYLIPRYGIDPAEGLKGHFDAGCPASPGDYLEQWTRHHRGEGVADPTIDFHPERVDPAKIDPGVLPRPGSRAFDTILDRQQALADLGFDLGEHGTDGEWTEDALGALLAFQTTAGLVADGWWGRQTEAAVRLALAALADGAWPPND